MQPHPPTPSLEVRRNDLSDADVRELRAHPGAREVGYGWLRIIRPESFPGRVLLVSTLKPMSITFCYGTADLDQMRASLRAAVYALNNPEQLDTRIKQAVERGQIPIPVL